MTTDLPNIVLIYADDLGYGDLGCYESDVIRTPHLDQLASDGVRFTNWYSCAPVCSPSRAALLTGRYPERTGVTSILAGKRGTTGLPADELTLAALLKPLGYATGMSGKWHLGVAPEHGPNAHGFDEFFGLLAGCVDYYSHIFYWGQTSGVNPVHDLWHNDQEVWYNGEYLTELITSRAVDFIERHADAPFLLYVPYNAPHYPMHAPQHYLDRFADLPPDRRVMAAMVAALDDGVGAIVAALRQIGAYDNTLIFFSSDNGPSTESRNWLDGTEDLYYGGSAGLFRGHKGSLFEGGIREPALLSFPARLAGGRVCAETCMMADLVPTVLDLVGLAAPPNHLLDGRSLVPMLIDGQSGPHDVICWAYQEQRAVRHGPWKLVLNGKLDLGRPAAEAVHLARLDDDPGERNNLAEQFPEVVEQLTAVVQSWYSDVTAPRPT